MFPQYQLWEDCDQNCSFCSLGIKESTSIDLKEKRIDIVMKHISDNYNIVDKIGFIGGEFFNDNQINGLSNWYSLLDCASKHCKTLLLTATLTNKIVDDSCLLDTIHFLKDINADVLLCTSYDTFGRFKSKEQLDNWLYNINYLHDIGIKLSSTSILTNKLLNDPIFFKIPKFVSINVDELYPGMEFFRNLKETDNYHSKLIEFTWIKNLLPKRNDALSFFKSNQDIARHYLSCKEFHPHNVYTFKKNRDVLDLEFENRFSNTRFISKSCKHPVFSKCYVDSDKCMMCDCENLLN